MIVKTLVAAAAGVASALVIAAPRAPADPVRFPDMSGYIPVNAHDYEMDASTPGMPATQVFFLTPDGIQCRFRKPAAAGCVGNNLPAIPPVPANPASGVQGVNSIGTDTGLQQTNESYPADNKIQGRPIKNLPPFHTITVDGVICGADDSGTTACKDQQGRGFVLSPRGSGWLPHV